MELTVALCEALLSNVVSNISEERDLAFTKNHDLAVGREITENALNEGMIQKEAFISQREAL